MCSLRAKRATKKPANRLHPRRWQRSFAVSLLALTAGLALSASPSQAAELSGKADLFLARKAAHHSKQGWTAVIVKLSAELTLEQQSQLKALDADVYRHLPIIHSVAANIPNRN